MCARLYAAVLLGAWSYGRGAWGLLSYRLCPEPGLSFGGGVVI